MHELLTVKRLEPCRDLEADRYRGLELERPLALDLLLQRTAGQELEHQVRHALVVPGSEHGHHVTGADPARDARLTGEAPAKRLILRKVGLDELERDLLVAGPDRLVHPSHSALAEHSLDPVGADAVTGPGF